MVPPPIRLPLTVTVDVPALSVPFKVRLPVTVSALLPVERVSPESIVRFATVVEAASSG